MQNPYFRSNPLFSVQQSPSALLFIPDISGFTNFVKATDIQHSQHIISELLEVLLDSNQLGLTMAEIEGDAILFYKEGDLPTAAELMTQAENMFLAFHEHLRYYDTHRICQCGACSSASRLSLKFVAHGGQIGFVELKNIRKPHGEDVILVHRLLKNNIENHEYLLLSEGLNLQAGAESFEQDWAVLTPGQSSYDDVGTLNYQYVALESLHDKVPEPDPIPPLDKIANPIQLSATIQRPMLELYEILINFEHRLKFNEELTGMDYNEQQVNRVGSKHVCLVGKKEANFQTVGFTAPAGKLAYSERVTDPPIIDELTVVYLLSPAGNGTQISVEAHYKVSGFARLLSPLFRMAMKKQIQKTIGSLKQLAEGGYLSEAAA